MRARNLPLENSISDSEQRDICIFNRRRIAAGCLF